MSKYLNLAANLALKVQSLTDAQKAAVKEMEAAIKRLEATQAMAIQVINADVEKNILSKAQGESEIAIAKAQIRASISEQETKIREINPAWVANAGQAVQAAAQNSAITGLELIGKGMGFIGRAIETSRAAADKANLGGFSKQKKPDLINLLSGEEVQE